jgi:hypothetical protein
MTQDLIFNASSNYSIAPPTAGSLTSLKLSGEYAGKGRLVIYLDTGNNSYLVLAKENATRFESECGGACTLNENADNYTLRISMPESGVLRLRSITPIVSHLQEFTLEPANRTFKASPGGDISGSINIENKMGERLALAIYGEGNLTPYLTLNASYLLLDQGTAANIAYSIDLPESMKEGLYTEKIIVRYLPGETFTGAVPIEAHMINVIVPSPLSETRIGKNYLPPLLLIVFIILLLIPIFSQARKMILRRRLQNNAAQSNANNDSRGY